MGRMERVNQQVKREIGIIVQRELNDPRLQFVTITRADVSPDLHNARIYYSVLGDNQNVKEAGEGLNSARGMIKRLLSKAMKIRRTPDLSFLYDDTIECSVRIDKTIEEIRDEHKEDNPSDK
ncbi:MAG: 30S ribosome-binding factor RbfA [Candidatus Zapsychrus exili]|nr:30S ribosome-binding factor RbfA [Candidatus Zapsychrus exili]